MKTAICFCVAASIAALAASFALAAPDYTANLEFVGAPNAERWPSSQTARHVQDLFPYQGKIYTSGGDWNNNASENNSSYVYPAKLFFKYTIDNN